MKGMIEDRLIEQAKGLCTKTVQLKEAENGARRTQLCIPTFIKPK
jgi:hypothetical protein